MKHFLLVYDFVPDYMDRRGQYRNDHLRYAWSAVERKELILGGALADPPDHGYLLFAGDDADLPARFAANDPYVVNGLVTSWQVREWTTVVGTSAATPVKPE